MTDKTDLDEDFKWDENEQAYSLLEKGQYKMICIDSEIKKTKNEQGSYIKLCFEVVDDERAGARVYDMMIIAYTGGQDEAATIRIGRAKLAQVTKALNIDVFSFKETSQLHHKELLCQVKIDDNPGYKPKNVITAYSSVDVHVSDKDVSEVAIDPKTGEEIPF